MSWLKLDDQFYDHPKILRAGPIAAWLHVAAMSYCSRHLTDGKVPSSAVPALARFDAIAIFGEGEQRGPALPVNTYALADKLVEVGLWERDGTDYQIHDYLEYNPARDAVLAEREAARERMRRGRTPQTPAKSPVPDVRPKFARSSEEVQAPRTRPVPRPQVRKYGEKISQDAGDAPGVVKAGSPEMAALIDRMNTRKAG